jgi:hypothetical protein
MIKLKDLLKEYIELDVKIGDTVFMGKFKNKKVEVKSIGWNEKGDLLINNKSAMKMRIPKHAKQVKEQNITEMDNEKRAFLMLKIYGQSWGVNMGKIFSGINKDKPTLIKKGLKEIKILNKKMEEMIEELI